MIRNITLSILIFSVGLAGCNNAGEKSSKTDPTAVAEGDSSVMAEVSGDAHSRDSLAADAEHKSSDTETVNRIKKLLPVILAKELVGADSSARRFIYDEADLNGDGKNELFVGFTGMNWCGSGGCTALLLSSEGEKITQFTVADFPFTVLNQETKGWKDLVVYSGGKDRLLRWSGKGYPANPSVAPRFTGKLSDDAPKALAIATKSSPWITF